MAFFQRPLPIFNRYSFDVDANSQEKLLAPQRQALRRLQEFFGEENRGRIPLVSMPTGSGKTGVISILPFFLGKLGLQGPPDPGAPPYEEPLHKFDKPVLVIAPDLAIADQLEERLSVSANAQGENFLLKTEIIPPDALYALPVVHQIKETKELSNPEFLQTKNVIIANAQKFIKDKWEEVLRQDTFKLVIVDEAHHYPAKTWRRIIRKFRNHAMIVFFTATPYRGDGRLVLEEKEGELVFHLSLKDAREQRIIRRINWPRLSVGETDDDRFTLILEKVKSIQEAKDLNNPLPDGIPHMAIAITKNIAFAQQVADLWNNRWGNHSSAIAYHSDVQPKNLKGKMMEAIKTNQIQADLDKGMSQSKFKERPSIYM